MESLSDISWDVVLSGTGLPQSLLALALSRSGKRVLHVDKNDYYGGAEAALSLQEAELWAKAINTEEKSGLFHHASLERPQQETDVTQLGFPRSYSLSLAPQLVYTRSNLLPALVSSKVYRQLEFLAVGCWHIYEDVRNHKSEEKPAMQPLADHQELLHKIPGGREDVFADKTIDLRSARSLMKFLKVAAAADTHPDILSEWGSKPFPDFLTSQFHIPPKLQSPLLALTLSPSSGIKTTTQFALPRICRHLTSIGMFGPGFGAVMPKWGGLAEVAQVACRAGAVGGGVYVLQRGIKSIVQAQDQTMAKASMEGKMSAPVLNVQLSNDERIRTQWIAATSDHLPLKPAQSLDPRITNLQRSITIISSPLSELFPAPVEGSPPPDGAVVVFPSGSLHTQEPHPPVYLLVHTSGTGECPAGQCVVYAYCTPSSSAPADSRLLSLAISKLIATIHETPKPVVLWRLSYQHKIHEQQYSEIIDDHIIRMPDVPPGPVLEDDVLRNVRETWERIIGNDVGKGFLNFEDREPVEDEEGYE